MASVGCGGGGPGPAPRDRWTGWEPERQWQRLRFAANNRRFLILPGVQVKNPSRLLAPNTRCLAANWQAVFGQPLLLLKTFIDQRPSAGTSYWAAGWLRLGEMRGYRRAGRRYHFRRHRPGQKRASPLPHSRGPYWRCHNGRSRWSSRQGDGP